MAALSNKSKDVYNSAERIAKVIARSGLCSRRDAEVLIAEGRVSVNGSTIGSAALDVSEADAVLVDGKPLAVREAPRLWRYYKPKGRVTTHKDPEGRPTVFEALPEDLPRLISVGRLDFNTEGLLLLTNDGDLARHLELPSTGWTRRYRVRAHGQVEQEQLDQLAAGITLAKVNYGPIEASLEREQGDNVWISLSIREGKNREVRRIMEHLGLVVNRLIRVSFGPFMLGDLTPGQVEEVKTSVLKDQLGPRLSRQFGVRREPVREEKRLPPARGKPTYLRRKGPDLPQRPDRRDMERPLKRRRVFLQEGSEPAKIEFVPEKRPRFSQGDRGPRAERSGVVPDGKPGDREREGRFARSGEGRPTRGKDGGFKDRDRDREPRQASDGAYGSGRPAFGAKRFVKAVSGQNERNNDARVRPEGNASLRRRDVRAGDEAAGTGERPARDGGFRRNFGEGPSSERNGGGDRRTRDPGLHRRNFRSGGPSEEGSGERVRPRRDAISDRPGSRASGASREGSAPPEQAERRAGGGSGSRYGRASEGRSFTKREDGDRRPYAKARPDRSGATAGRFAREEGAERRDPSRSGARPADPARGTRARFGQRAAGEFPSRDATPRAETGNARPTGKSGAFGGGRSDGDQADRPRADTAKGEPKRFSRSRTDGQRPDGDSRGPRSGGRDKGERDRTFRGTGRSGEGLTPSGSRSFESRPEREGPRRSSTAGKRRDAPDRRDADRPARMTRSSTSGSERNSPRGSAHGGQRRAQEGRGGKPASENKDRGRTSRTSTGSPSRPRPKRDAPTDKETP